MVDELKINGVNNSVALNYSDFSPINLQNDDEENISIFNFDSDSDADEVTEENILLLSEKLDSVEDKQGVFSNVWSNFKEAVGVGTSASKCDDAIEQYANGEISFDEAYEKISEFEQKQDSSLNLFSNIATSVTAIAVTTAAAAAIVASGGTATPLVLAAIGAGTGAVTKAGFKLTDRATNEVDGDALDAKQIAKDGLSGAVTGGIAAATMGTGSAADTLGSSVIKSGLKSARTGAITGSISGGSNYLIDTSFDDDKDFSTKEFLSATTSNALAGSTVGLVIGGSNGALRSTGILKAGGMVKESMEGSLENASVQDVVANSVCTTEYKVLNDRLHSIAA